MPRQEPVHIELPPIIGPATRVIDLRPERPAGEWDACNFVLTYAPDSQGYRLFHYHYGQHGTFMATCVLWIPDDVPGVTRHIEALKRLGTTESSTFTNNESGNVLPFPLTKVWLRDTTAVRELVDILRAGVDNYRAGRRNNPWAERWPTFENPVGVFS